MKNCFLCGILLVVSIVSCTRAPNHPPVYPVSGRVLYQGKPTAGAVVILHALGEPASAVRPRGRANAEGEFDLTTYQNGDGAPAGLYTVTVEWKRADDHPEQGKDLLPSVYGDPKSSRLRVEVIEGANQPLLLQLKAKP